MVLTNRFGSSQGDCWLLSAMSALAEYEGTITKIFASTPNLQFLPSHEHNTYLVNLYDVGKNRPVQIAVDERLCCRADSSSGV